MNWIDQLITKQAKHPSGLFGRWIMPSILDLSTLEQNRQTIRKIDLKSGQTLLDVGCATGQLVKMASESCIDAKITGIDTSMAMLASAKKNNRATILSGHVNILQTSWYDLDFANNTFDKVSASNVVYFWDNPVEILNNIYRVMKNNSQIIISFRIDETLDYRLMNQYGYKLFNGKQVRQFMSEANFIDLKIEDKNAMTRTRQWKIVWLSGIKTG